MQCIFTQERESSEEKYSEKKNNFFFSTLSGEMPSNYMMIISMTSKWIFEIDLVTLKKIRYFYDQEGSM